MKFHESLLIKTQHEHLRRFIRVIIAEEQAHLLELMHTQIELYHNLALFSNIGKVYNDSLYRAKYLFEQDQLAFPMIALEERPQNIFEENYRQRSFSINSRNMSQNSFSSQIEEGKFTPVNLDLVEIQLSSMQDRPPTIYATAKKDSFCAEPSDMCFIVAENSGMPLGQLRAKLHKWIINPADLKYIKPIGNGSSAEVWLGVYNKKQVAIKKQKPTESRKSNEFFRELTLMVNLKHPNLVTFIGACLDNPICIVTEYCAGGDLFTLLHKKKEVFVSWQQKLKILQEIAKGMIFLHNNSYIHRDLKSLNILLCSELKKSNDLIELKISDFGLSREFSEDSFMTGQLGTCH